MIPRLHMTSPDISQRPTVLIADPCEKFRKRIRLALARNFHVVESCVISEALPSSELNRPSVVITGARSGQSSCGQLMRRLRDWHPGTPLLTIGVTAEDFEGAAPRSAPSSELTMRASPAVIELAVAQVVWLGKSSTTDEKPDKTCRLSDRIMNRASMREEIEKIHFHYQLIWSQETNVAVGYECLMRSNSSHFRSPRSFIFEVTRLGLSKALNQHLDDLAVSYIEKLPACGSIFLNAAYVDLQHILHSKIADHANRVVIDFPKYESEAAFENGFDIFDRLRSKGFRIAIDDAGTAGDDLSLILHVRPDFVKLDHALIRDVHLHKDRQELIRLFVSYFDLKGIVAIAEGVEKEAEANMLQSLGVDQMQGFFFAPPSIQAPRTPVYKYQDPEPTRRIS